MRDKIRGIKGFHMGAANPTPLDELRRKDAPRGSQATISAPTPEDSTWQQFKTFVSNPFDGTRALVNEARGDIREAFGLSDQGDRDGVYGSLTNLRRANDSFDFFPCCLATIKKLNAKSSISFLERSANDIKFLFI